MEKVLVYGDINRALIPSKELEVNGGSGGSLPSGNENEVLAYNAQNQAEATKFSYKHWKNTDILSPVEDDVVYGLTFAKVGTETYQWAVPLVIDSVRNSIAIRDSNGFLHATQTPEEGYHVTNKDYVDNLVANISGTNNMFSFVNMVDCRYSFNDNRFIYDGAGAIGNFSYNLNLHKEYEWDYEFEDGNFNATTYFEILVDNTFVGYLQLNKDTRTIEWMDTSQVPQSFTMDDSSYVLRCLKTSNEVIFFVANTMDESFEVYMSFWGKDINVNVTVFDLTDDVLNVNTLVYESWQYYCNRLSNKVSNIGTDIKFLTKGQGLFANTDLSTETTVGTLTPVFNGSMIEIDNDTGEFIIPASMSGQTIRIVASSFITGFDTSNWASVAENTSYIAIRVNGEMVGIDCRVNISSVSTQAEATIPYIQGGDVIRVVFSNSVIQSSGFTFTVLIEDVLG